MYYPRRVTFLVVAVMVLALLVTGSPAMAAQLGNRTLRVGVSGDDVSELQRSLTQLGFYSFTVTGYFGEITRTAVVDFQRAHGLTVDGIAGPQTVGALQQALAARSQGAASYTVRAGDSLWSIANRNGITVNELRSLNGLASDVIHVGQTLALRQTQSYYTVQRGDSLWAIANRHGTSVAELQRLNGLSGSNLLVGQRLLLPSGGSVAQPNRPQPVLNWPAVTYIVQPGDNVGTVARRFGVPASNIIRFNYMQPDQWLNAGQKIAISGYAPRQYTVTPGEESAPARSGKVVDWFLEGQYLIRRNDVFTIVDVETGRQFRVVMMGGYNHVDIEPLTARDTAIMHELFGFRWTWAPRPVVVFHNGMNIAASLSGMPHSFNTVDGNNVQGHFDVYLLNSRPHGSASAAYLEQHRQAIMRAAR